VITDSGSGCRQDSPAARRIYVELAYLLPAALVLISGIKNAFVARRGRLV